MIDCTLLFLRRGDEILLAMKKRGFGADRWNGVGGKVEAGETIEQALVRECQEEIGVTPLRYRQVAEHTFLIEGDVPDIHAQTFVCDHWQGKPIETDEMAPRWFKLTDIPYDDMWQDDIVWLPLVLRGKLLHTTFTFAADEHMTGAELKIVDQLG